VKRGWAASFRGRAVVAGRSTQSPVRGKCFLEACMTTRTAVRSRFFLYMAFGFLAIALIGFSTTFFIPLARGTFSAPPIIHLHGALLFGWLFLFILQSSLIHRRSLL